MAINTHQDVLIEAQDYTDDHVGPGTHSHDITDVTNLQDALDDKVDESIVGEPLGIAELDGGGKVPASQLPSTLMDYKGNWDVVTNTPTLADGTGDAGDVYLVSVAGTRDLGSGPITFALGDWCIYNGSIWQKSVNSNAVTSVNGYTGPVVLGKSDVGLGNADNTSDADKPISSATQTALNGKEPANSNIQTHISSTSNPHSVTKSQVGLGNCDNTSDANKPISSATQSALNAKANDADVFHKATANEFSGLTEQQNGFHGDLLLLEASSSSYAKRKVSMTYLFNGCPIWQKNRLGAVNNNINLTLRKADDTDALDFCTMTKNDGQVVFRITGDGEAQINSNIRILGKGKKIQYESDAGTHEFANFQSNNGTVRIYSGGTLYLNPDGSARDTDINYSNNGGVSLCSGTSTGKVVIGATGDGVSKLSVNGAAAKSSGGTAWATYSDIRLKSVIEKPTRFVDKLKKLIPIRFKWNGLFKKHFGENKEVNYGFSAQNVKNVFPEMIRKASNGFLMYTPNGFEAILTGAIKEQQSMIDSLRKEISILKNTISKMVKK